jgi:hypothetical protein
MESADEREQLAQLLQETQRAALEALEGIDPNCVIYEDGGWTVRDIIEYIISREVEGLAVLHAHNSGEDYSIEGSHLDFEQIRDVEAERLYAEWEAVRELLRAAIIEMPPNRLLMVMDSAWGEYGHVHKFIGDLITSQRQHIDAILHSIERRVS